MIGKIVLFDLETGGLDRFRHPIIQIAAVAVNNIDLTLAESFEVKIKFKIEKADPQALELNSYDPETWEIEAVSPYQACESLSEFLKKHADVEMRSKKTGRSYKVAQLGGFNADRFDGPFLQQWYKRLDKFMPGTFSVLDTRQMAMWYFNELGDGSGPEKYSLESICEYLEIAYEDKHDAKADVAADLAVWRELRRRRSDWSANQGRVGA